MESSRDRRSLVLTRRDVDDLRAGQRDTENYFSARRDSEGRGRTTTKDLGSLALTLLEIAAGAAVVGYAAGRTGTTQIGNTGIPYGAAAGALGLAYSMYGNASASPHVRNVSLGAAGMALGMWAIGQGVLGRQRAGLPTGPIVAGVDGMGAYAPPQQLGGPAYAQQVPGQPPMSYAVPGEGSLTEAELQAMAQQAYGGGR